MTEEELYQCCQDKAKLILHKFKAHAKEMEDIGSDAYLKLVKSDSFDIAQAKPGVIYNCIKNMAIDIVRHKNRKCYISTVSKVNMDHDKTLRKTSVIGENVVVEINGQVSRTFEPFQVVDDLENVNWLLDQLPEDSRDALIIKSIVKDDNEGAAILGIDFSCYKSRVHRARKKLSVMRQNLIESTAKSDKLQL